MTCSRAVSIPPDQAVSSFPSALLLFFISLSYFGLPVFTFSTAHLLPTGQASLVNVLDSLLFRPSLGPAGSGFNPSLPSFTNTLGRSMNDCLSKELSHHLPYPPFLC